MAKEGWYGFIAVATKVDDNNCRQFFVDFCCCCCWGWCLCLYLFRFQLVLDPNIVAVAADDANVVVLVIIVCC